MANAFCRYEESDAPAIPPQPPTGNGTSAAFLEWPETSPAPEAPQFGTEHVEGKDHPVGIPAIRLKSYDASASTSGIADRIAGHKAARHGGIVPAIGQNDEREADLRMG